jgi:hypothetical protein
MISDVRKTEPATILLSFECSIDPSKKPWLVNEKNRKSKYQQIYFDCF